MFLQRIESPDEIDIYAAFREFIERTLAEIYAYIFPDENLERRKDDLH